MDRVLRIKRKPLISVLEKVNLALPTTKAPISSITQVKMTIEEDKLIFVATDLRKAITTFLLSDNDNWKGSTDNKEYLLPGKLVLDILRKVNDEEVIFQLSPSKLGIKTEKSSFSFQLMSVEDFPEIPELTDKESTAVSPKKIITLLKRGLYAAAKEIEREGLSGALFQYKEGKIRVVSTDGHRLSLAEGEVDGDKKNSFSCILHSSDLKVDYFSIFNLEEDIYITWDNHQINFHQGLVKLTLKTMNIKFPDYEGIIPTNFSTYMEAKTSNLLDPLERLTLLSSVEPIKFDIKEKVLVSLTVTGIGEGSEELELEEKGGSDLEINFNSRYLLEALKNSQSEKIYMGFNSSLSPVTISNRKLIENKDESEDSYYLALVMPLQF